MKVSDYIDSLPDAGIENSIAKELIGEGEDNAFEFIEELLNHGERKIRKSGLYLTKKIVKKKDCLERILEIGLLRYDVEEIEAWFDAVIPRLGAKRAIGVVSSFADTDTKAVVRCWYKLKRIVLKKYPESLERLVCVEDMVNLNVSNLDAVDKKAWERLGNWRK